MDADAPVKTVRRAKKKRTSAPLACRYDSVDPMPPPAAVTPTESVGTENVTDLMREIERMSSADVKACFNLLNAKMLDCDSDSVWDAYTERMRIIARDTLAAAAGRNRVAAPHSL